MATKQQDRYIGQTLRVKGGSTFVVVRNVGTKRLKVKITKAGPHSKYMDKEIVYINRNILTVKLHDKKED